MAKVKLRKKDKLAPLQSPEHGWGVTMRKRKIQDFKFALTMLACAAVFTPLAFAPALASIPVGSQRIGPLGLFFAASFGFLALAGAYHAKNYPAVEAMQEAQAKALDWQNDVLAPHLESKYGIKFLQKQNFFAWGYALAEKNGRMISMNIRGVEVKYDYRFGDDYSFPYYRIYDDDVYLDEIIPTTKLTAKPLHAIA